MRIVTVIILFIIMTGSLAHRAPVSIRLAVRPIYLAARPFQAVLRIAHPHAYSFYCTGDRRTNFSQTTRLYVLDSKLSVFYGLALNTIFMHSWLSSLDMYLWYSFLQATPVSGRVY